MGTAIAVRTAYSSKELRRLASRVKNAGQARRLLAIAAVLDGASRQEAAIDLRNSEISQFEETIERSTSHVCATLVETETQRARLSRSGLLSLILG
jgi:hypothetical protein